MRHRILYLVTSSGWGGAERYVSVLATAAAEEYDIHVLTGNSATSEKLFENLPEGASYGTLQYFRREISPWNDLRATEELRKYIDEHSIDLIHCNSSKAGLIGALAARRSAKRPKVVYTAHGWGFLEKRSFLFRKAVLWSEKLASSWRSATIVLSEMERQVALNERLSAPERLHVIPHGINAGDISFMGREDARRGLEVNGIVVGTIANAYPAKALDLLILAFEAVAEKYKDARLVIIGDGPEMDNLRKLKGQSPANPRILLKGYLYDAASYLKAFDVFVLSSTKEGLPWSVLEASLAGCPIIATSVGALPEIIRDEETGLLTEPGNADALSEAIDRVLGNETLRRKLKNGALRIAGLRSSSRMLERTFDVYRQLLRSTPR